MDETLQFLIRHGYSVVFLVVLAEQLGLPLPAPPLLLAAGALAGSGEMSIWLVITLAVLASLIGDGIWFELGRRRGGRVLSFLCRVSLEPDVCVRKTEDAFARNGARSVLFAKFIPGLSTMAPPLAGVIGMRPGRFFFLDTFAAILYFGSFTVLGYVFSDQLEKVVSHLESLGFWLLVIIVACLAAYLGWKFYQRWRYIHSLRVARITPEELKRKIEAGEEIVVVDLRHAFDSEAKPSSIPGAIRLTPEKVDEGHQQIPRDRDIVLFCT